MIAANVRAPPCFCLRTTVNNLRGGGWVGTNQRRPPPTRLHFLLHFLVSAKSDPLEREPTFTGASLRACQRSRVQRRLGTLAGGILRVTAEQLPTQVLHHRRRHASQSSESSTPEKVPVCLPSSKFSLKISSPLFGANTRPRLAPTLSPSFFFFSFHRRDRFIADLLTTWASG